MKKATAPLDWTALEMTQPAAALIPSGLRAQAKIVEAQAGETLFLAGDPVRSVHLVISGETRLVRRDRDGGEVILQRSRGGFIAEASLDPRSYHCDASASEPTTVLAFPAGAFRSVLDADSAFRRAWQSHLAREVRKLRAQCERLCLRSAADRINHYIQSEGSGGVLTLTQSRKAWAAELGLSHEALYRTLRSMRDDGSLAIDGDRMTAKG